MMTNIHGHCVCGAVEIAIKEYGSFVYACHCDTCRRMQSGPVLSVDPGPKENVEFVSGSEKIAIYHNEEVELGFCSACGTSLFWHNPADNHYCMNAELFDDIIKNASFDLELFYDMKPAYYSFAGQRRKLDRNFEEITNAPPNINTKGCVNMNEMQFCQSCAMPLNPEVLGTEADGSPSQDYCHYCYKNGAFTVDETMEQMIETCVPFTVKATGKPEAEVRAEMQQYFPQLKRWKK